MNNTTENNAIEELNRFLKMLLKHWKMIITSAVLTIIIFAVFLFFVITPKYQATTQLIVNQKTKDSQVSDIQQLQSADIQMINTYKSIVTSPVISDTVNNNLGNDAKIKKSKVSVDTQTNSQVFSINANSPDDSLAPKLANETALVFQNKIKHIMNVNNVTVIAKAQKPKVPSSPNKKLGLLAGVVVGIVIGIMLSLFKEYTSRTIESTDFISNELKLTNLGIVNDIKSKKSHRNR